MASKKAKAGQKPHGEPPQARPFWSGVITFGLVSLPVSLFPANRGKAVRLSMTDTDGTPLRRRYFCEKEHKILHKDDILRGFPVGQDKFVIVEDAELQDLEPEKTREIDLRRFVPREEVNPVFFVRGYFLAPDSRSTKAYRLLARTLEEEQRVGIATFVMRDREYIIAIIAEKGILRAETLRFHDEIRSPEAVGLGTLPPADKASVKRIAKDIDSLADSALNRHRLADPQASKIQSLAEDKRSKGQDVVTQEAGDLDDEQGNVIDLMQVLKDRLKGKTRAGKSRKPEKRPPDRKSRAKASMESFTREEIYRQAQDLDIPGRSKMSKKQLWQAIQKAG